MERTPGAGLDVVCDVAPGEQNLAAKLVRELEARLERTFEVRVTIDKHVPHGGGLGGGSSDAAATLVALERLFALDLSPRLRHEVAAAVGSDVPFFLWPGPQLAMGRGQVLKEVALPELHVVIAVPDLALSTAAVYRWRDEDAADDAQGVRAAGARALRARAGGADRRPTWPRWCTTTSRPSVDGAPAGGRRAARPPVGRGRAGRGHDRQRRRRVRPLRRTRRRRAGRGRRWRPPAPGASATCSRPRRARVRAAG